MCACTCSRTKTSGVVFANAAVNGSSTTRSICAAASSSSFCSVVVSSDGARSACSTLRGMRIEGVDDGLAVASARAIDHRAQDLAVTDVETVEVADREDRATRTAIERCAAPYDPQC